jgi:tetratricopeptide (TPR) repeat protein
MAEGAPFEADLYGALAEAERAAKKPEAAVAAARKAVAAAEKAPGNAWARASHQLALAEALAFAGQAAEARKAVEAALERPVADPALLANASALLLRLKDVPGAVARARSAVDVSEGGNATAQAALGEALAASGDTKGAAAAFARAAELEPENAAVRKRLEALQPKKPARPA